MDDLARRMAAGPQNFFHSFSAARDLILLVELNEAELTSTSFLDQRVLTKTTWGRWLPFADVQARLDGGFRDDAHHIFHIGHVGSTLISRLLGALPDAFSVREPLMLRELAAVMETGDAIDAPWNPVWLPDRTRVIRQLLARTFHHRQRAIIKATSFTSEFAKEFVSPEAKTLLLYATLESYMTTILAGDNSRAELAASTLPRLARFERRLADCPYRLWSLSEGERIAFGWVTEMLSLRAAADTLPSSSVLWVDFDAFLQAPVETVLDIAEHFELGLSRPDADQLVAGPIMQRYSKAPEHEYTPSLRKRLQDEAALRHRSALLEGRRLIAQMMARYPAIARLEPWMRPSA